MLAKRLKEKRLQKGLSQQALADAIGVTRISLVGYERGTKQPSTQVLKALAEELNCSTDYLLGLEDK